VNIKTYIFKRSNYIWKKVQIMLAACKQMI